MNDCCCNREGQDRRLVDQMNEMLIMRRRGPEVGQAISIELREFPRALKPRQLKSAINRIAYTTTHYYSTANPTKKQKHNTSMLKPPTLFEGIRGWTV